MSGIHFIGLDGDQLYCRLDTVQSGRWVPTSSGQKRAKIERSLGIHMCGGNVDCAVSHYALKLITTLGPSRWPDLCMRMSLTVHVQPGRVRGPPGPVFCCARVFPAVLHHHVANIHVTNDVTVHCYVLANHEPATSSETQPSLFILRSPGS
jgi:hypothetical protein